MIWYAPPGACRGHGPEAAIVSGGRDLILVPSQVTRALSGSATPLEFVPSKTRTQTFTFFPSPYFSPYCPEICISRRRSLAGRCVMGRVAAPHPVSASSKLSIGAAYQCARRRVRRAGRRISRAVYCGAHWALSDSGRLQKRIAAYPIPADQCRSVLVGTPPPPRISQPPAEPPPRIGVFVLPCPAMPGSVMASGLRISARSSSGNRPDSASSSRMSRPVAT
jgi:hypothetical protein